MPARTKRVNVTTVVAVRTTNPPICGTLQNIEMTTGDILKCLCKRAKVEEILSDGSTIRLNMKNYYTDNEPVVAATAPISVKPEPKKEEIVVEAETEKGGDTHESVEETVESAAAETDAGSCSEDALVESIEESAEEACERDEAMPEHEEVADEAAAGVIEAAVEEEVTTMLVLEDRVEVVDSATASSEVVVDPEVVTTLGSPVDECSGETKSIDAAHKSNNYTPKKKKK